MGHCILEAVVLKSVVKQQQQNNPPLKTQNTLTLPLFL